MARTRTAPNPAAQFQARGYIIDEAGDLALRDVAEGLDGIALLCEERSDDLPELTKQQLAGIFRTFSRMVTTITSEAGFVNQALARPRD
jgi:hypothetical protein|nr:MAG TPA: hypothetical protein [Caudoviricetes sp.]